MADRLRLMEIFVAVADAGSLVAAARALRISPAAVTRAVAALEDALGTTLLARTTRSLAVTEPGARYLERARRVLAEIAAAEEEAGGASAEPHGRLTVTTSLTFARRIVSPMMGPFLAAHPRLAASLVLSDRVVNLVEEGIDAAVRLGRLADSSLVARRVGTVRRILVASPSFAARHPAAHPRVLRRIPLVGYTALAATHEWGFSDGGRPFAVAVEPRYEVNDAEAALDAAEAGEGATVAMSYLVAERIAAGRLVPLLEAFAPPPAPVHIVTPPSRLPAPKVRAFVAFAAPRLGAALAAVEATLSGPSSAPGG
jgi:DNA-binding transcriptional LysR family regulator